MKSYFPKPAQFWSKMKEIAKLRYDFNLEEKTERGFDYIEMGINKFGLLKDFCVSVGIQIEANDYELYLDPYSNNNYYNRNQNPKEFKYSMMPFKSQNILGFFVVVKDYVLPSELHKPVYDQADALAKAGNFIESADKLKQLIYLSNEIYGPINFYSAIAHKKLGEMSFLDQDYINGIASLQKSIAIFEKMHEYDSCHVMNAYSELSTYYHIIQQDYIAFKYISRALEILNYIYPKNV